MCSVHKQIFYTAFTGLFASLRGGAFALSDRWYINRARHVVYIPIRKLSTCRPSSNSFLPLYTYTKHLTANDLIPKYTSTHVYLIHMSFILSLLLLSNK